jgi:hypothetical protein
MNPGVEIVSISEAMPFLRTMLQVGGSAVLIVNEEWRMLWYDPRVHGIASKRPWPFSSAQQLQGCELRISVAKLADRLPPTPGERLRTVEFNKRSDHVTAIAQFLAGAPCDANVMISELPY